MTDDPIQKVNELRQRVIAGEDLTKEEVKEAVSLLRANRRGATEVAMKKKAAKKSSVPLDLNALFGESNGEKKDS